MEFEVRPKTALNSETPEYSLLPIGAEEFFKAHEDDYSVRLNTRLRRPVFIAESEDIKIKAVLKSQKIRVSFSEERWESLKEEFEAFLNFSDS